MLGGPPSNAIHPTVDTEALRVHDLISGDTQNNLNRATPGTGILDCEP